MLTCDPKSGTFVPVMSTLSQARPLSETLFSRNRRAILGLLYGHPDQQFYFRQVVRASGGGHGAIQRELKHLSEAGIIRRDVRHGQVYFQASPECPIFEELKAIIVKTAGVADVLRTALAPWPTGSGLPSSTARWPSAGRGPAATWTSSSSGTRAFVRLWPSWPNPKRKSAAKSTRRSIHQQEFCTKLSARHHFLGNVLQQEKIFLIGDQRDLEGLAQQRLAE